MIAKTIGAAVIFAGLLVGASAASAAPGDHGMRHHRGHPPHAMHHRPMHRMHKPPMHRHTAARHHRPMHHGMMRHGH